MEPFSGYRKQFFHLSILQPVCFSYQPLDPIAVNRIFEVAGTYSSSEL